MSKPVGFDPVTGSLVIMDNGVFPARSLQAAPHPMWSDRVQIDSIAGRGEQIIRWQDVTSLDGSFVPASMDDALAYLRAEFARRRPLGATFVQTQPAVTWSITHTLGFVPAVTLVDTAGDVFAGDVRHVDEATILVTLSAPTAGAAYLS